MPNSNLRFTPIASDPVGALFPSLDDDVLVLMGSRPHEGSYAFHVNYEAEVVLDFDSRGILGSCEVLIDPSRWLPAGHTSTPAVDFDLCALRLTERPRQRDIDGYGPVVERTTDGVIVRLSDAQAGSTHVRLSPRCIAWLSQEGELLALQVTVTPEATSS